MLPLVLRYVVQNNIVNTLDGPQTPPPTSIPDLSIYISQNIFDGHILPSIRPSALRTLVKRGVRVIDCSRPSDLIIIAKVHTQVFPGLR